MSSSRRRAPAVKLKIVDIQKGEFVSEKDGSKALHVKTDDMIRRVRILGEISSKIIVENDESVLLEIEDETDAIKVKGGGAEWSGNIFLELREFKEGTTVDIIGLVKESSDGKPYIDCELAIPINDPMLKTLRDLEISKYYKKKGLVQEATASIDHALENQEKISESDKIKGLIIELLRKPENAKKGCSFEAIKKALALSSKEIEPALKSLQGDGDIFEPAPGIFKYVSS